MDREDRVKLALALAVVGIDLLGLAALDLSFDWPSAWKVALTWPVLMALAWFYTIRRPERRMAALLRETAHLLLFSAAAAVLSYLAASLDRPLIDDALIAVDRLIGFDWTGYVAQVNQRPWLGELSSIVYSSTLPQVAIAVILLPMLNRVEECRELVLAVMIAALVAIAVSAVFPSAGALGHLRPDPYFYLANRPVVDLAYKDAFFAMRAGEIPVLSLQGAKGLIAFPSYHVALSVLIVLSFRRNPRFFWSLLLLNTGVILATPVDGGHHLIDGLGGVAVAVASLFAAGAVRGRLGSAAAPQELQPAARPATTA